MTTQITDLQTHWPPIAAFFSIRSEAEYDAAVVRLYALLDEIGTNQEHPLYGVLDTLGTLIQTYESQHHAIPNASGPDVLRYLIDEHGLSLNDLPDIGDASKVSQYLSGQTELTVDQLRTLAQRVHVSPSAFMQ